MFFPHARFPGSLLFYESKSRYTPRLQRRKNWRFFGCQGFLEPLPPLDFSWEIFKLKILLAKFSSTLPVKASGRNSASPVLLLLILQPLSALQYCQCSFCLSLKKRIRMLPGTSKQCSKYVLEPSSNHRWSAVLLLIFRVVSFQKFSTRRIFLPLYNYSVL